MLALGIIGAIVLAILVRSVKIIGQAEVIVVERLGRFHRVARSGLNVLLPPGCPILGYRRIRCPSDHVRIDVKNRFA
jgi:regulator of protease activity HflC (stomatin/prohibitin superfamily)